jgi:hypothetical protein
MYRLKFLILIAFLFALSKNSGFGQTIKAENIRVENLKDLVVISYDLSNPQENSCVIELTMKKKADKSFRYQPKYLSGDIGEGSFNGSGKRIIWNKQKERLPIINIDDFYFEVNANVISGGNHTWLWVGAGAAVLGGGTALYFLLKKDNNKTESSQNTDMPQPPGRP